MDLTRDDILGCATPSELFGEAVADPRELRRAYARLAKAWKQEVEVGAHIRALFEWARDGRPEEPPRTDEDPLRAALESGDIDAVASALLGKVRHGVPPAALLDPLLLCVRMLPLLTTDRVDALEAVVQDPSWDLPDEVLLPAMHRFQLVRDLARARREGGVPEPILSALERGAVVSDIRELGAIWLETAEAMEGQDLEGIFADLEVRFPTLLGAWSGQEARLMRHVRELPPEVENAVEDGVGFAGALVSGTVLLMGTAAALWLVGITLGIGSHIFLAGATFGLPLWNEGMRLAPMGDADAQKRALRSRALPEALRSASGLVPHGPMQLRSSALGQLKRSAFGRAWRRLLHGDWRKDPTKPRSEEHAVQRVLEDLCHTRALFPRELARLLFRVGPFDVADTMLHARHPLLLLDQSDSALLRVLTPAHLERLEESP